MEQRSATAANIHAAASAEAVVEKGKREMSERLSEKKANIHVVIIGIFYLISGIWEYLVGLTQAEHICPGEYFLLDVFRKYAVILGLITIIVGIVLLCRRNVGRLAALGLAWWNLVTAPAILIWWDIYSIKIKKFLILNPELHKFDSFLYTSSVIVIISFLRIYIIRMLRASKAGYIFLRK